MSNERTVNAILPIYEQLLQVLPDLLPKNPGEAITGTELLAKVRNRITTHSDNTIRQMFSILSQNASSPIAKVEQGQGYYLRPIVQTAEQDTPSIATLDSESEEYSSAIEVDVDTEIVVRRRVDQDEEKFRALFLQHQKDNGHFPMHVEHLAGARRASGQNKWKYPDVVVIEWDTAILDADCQLNKPLLQVRQSLGQPPFNLEPIRKPRCV